ncbi:MAG: thioredoxin [Geminicoccaceae bacterium]|jgi:thioredoxin-related protein|nr:MAG: thioredoxin [Geminicoccaceae bacterium]
MPLARRTLFGLAAGTVLARTARAVVTDASGLPGQPWFLQSFLDLREDLQTAAGNGKRLVILIEQRGCPFCKQLHEVNFAEPGITEWIRPRFEILQLDLHGAREVTDLDGKTYEERAFARAIAGQMTPVAIFLPADPAEALGRPTREVAVAKMPGYLPPREFLLLFRYVHEEAYRRESFESYRLRQA